MTETHTAGSAAGPAGPDARADADADADADAADRNGDGTTEPAGRWDALRRPDTWIPLALLTVFLVLWALVLARPTFLTSFDVWVRDRVQNRAHSDLDGAHRWPLIKHVADLGGGVAADGVPFRIQVPMVTMGAVALAVAAVRRSWRPLAAAAAGYAALVLVLILKAAGDRPGPSMAGQTLTDGLGYFPSGHTGNTVLGFGTSALILAFVLTAGWARLAITAAMTLFALAMGFSLVWMDYHWLSDVLGSYALCGAALFGVGRILGFRVGVSCPERSSRTSGATAT